MAAGQNLSKTGGFSPDGMGGEVNDNSGDTYEDAVEAGPGQQLPSLPDMIGQDGKPLIVPIERAKDRGRYAKP